MKGIINRIGEIYTFSDGRTMKIIEYFNTDNITVIFNDMSISKNERYSRFKIGQIKNKNTPVVCGVGYFGYGDYSEKNNLICYGAWKGMISRCYHVNSASKNPTYSDCSVHPDWHNFQVFAKWFYNNYKDGFQLDKDILFKGNRVYSAKNCCFVPKDINVLFTSGKKIRGNNYIGVFRTKNNKKYSAQISINSKNIYLGTFSTEIDAFLEYKKEKEKNIKIVANKHKSNIIPECYNALMNWTIDIND